MNEKALINYLVSFLPDLAQAGGEGKGGEEECRSGNTVGNGRVSVTQRGPTLEQASPERVRATQHRGATEELGTDQGVQALGGHPFSLGSQTLSLLPLLTSS